MLKVKIYAKAAKAIELIPLPTGSYLSDSTIQKDSAVTINRKPAPDGKYSFQNGVTIEVTNGYVVNDGRNAIQY